MKGVFRGLLSQWHHHHKLKARLLHVLLMINNATGCHCNGAGLTVAHDEALSWCYVSIDVTSGQHFIHTTSHKSVLYAMHSTEPAVDFLQQTNHKPHLYPCSDYSALLSVLLKWMHLQCLVSYNTPCRLMKNMFNVLQVDWLYVYTKQINTSTLQNSMWKSPCRKPHNHTKHRFIP